MYGCYDVWINKVVLKNRMIRTEWKNGWTIKQKRAWFSSKCIHLLSVLLFIKPLCVCHIQTGAFPVEFPSVHHVLSQECCKGSSVKAQALATKTGVSGSAQEACLAAKSLVNTGWLGEYASAFIMLVEPGPPILGGSSCLFFVSPAHHSLHLRFLDVDVGVVSSSTVCRGQQPPAPLDLRMAISNPAGSKG